MLDSPSWRSLVKWDRNVEKRLPKETHQLASHLSVAKTRYWWSHGWISFDCFLHTQKPLRKDAPRLSCILFWIKGDIYLWMGLIASVFHCRPWSFFLHQNRSNVHMMRGRCIPNSCNFKVFTLHLFSYHLEVQIIKLLQVCPALMWAAPFVCRFFDYAGWFAESSSGGP